MKLLVILALVGCALAAPSLPKSQRKFSKLLDPAIRFPNMKRTPLKKLDVPEERIVGGSECEPHKYPHQAALTIDYLYFCGGQLISPNYVMTAAHCVDGDSRWEVTLGAHNLKENEPEQVNLISTDAMAHEDWKPFLIQNDIALIKLPEPVTFNENIKPVALPTTDIGPGVDVTVTGWGRTDDDIGAISDVLMEAVVPTITNEECNSFYGVVVDTELCIDSNGGHGTCNGDSGGPLVLSDGNGGWVTHGITSFGSSAGCEAGYPDAFTRVYAYVDWIKEHTDL